MADQLPSWWPVVKSAMASQGVAVRDWLPILMAESRGDALAYNRSTGPNPGDQPEESVGLFQLNRMGGQGAGFTVEQLQNPAINAEIAARYIGPAVKKCGSGNLACIAVNSGHPGPVDVTDNRVQTIVGYWRAIKEAGSELEMWVKSLAGQPAPVEGGGGGIGMPGLAELAGILNPLNAPGAISDGLAKLFGLPTRADLAWSIVFGSAGVVCIVIGLAGLATESGAAGPDSGASLLWTRDPGPLAKTLLSGGMAGAAGGRAAAAASSSAGAGVGFSTVTPAQAVRPLRRSFKVIDGQARALPTPADLDAVLP